MHLCFVDESGTPAKPNRLSPRFFVIAGVVVPEERWHSLANKLRGLKVAEQFKGELKWRYFAPANNDAANPMAAWPHDRRNAFRTKVFSILGTERSLRIVAGVCEAGPAYAVNGVVGQSDLYYRTYKVVTERFQYLLQDISRQSGRDTCGIIVADHRGKGDDEQLRLQHQRLIETDAQYTSTYRNLVEGLFLAPSHMSVGIQFADMVAGAIWRRFEKNDAASFDLVAPSFRRAPDGKLDGWGIARFPVRGWTGPVIGG